MSDKQATTTELLKIIDRIPGWLSQSEQLTLLHLPAFVDPLGDGAIVEIGSFMGKSTIALGFGSTLLSTKKRFVYAIDPFMSNWNPFDMFWQNIKMAGLENCIIPIKKYSNEAYDDCPNTIALLFIDGDHSYEMVKHDILHYIPGVIQGGFIAFHDYNGEGVARAVNELYMNEKFEHIGLYDTLLVIRKR